jgi:hypothetical protein
VFFDGANELKTLTLRNILLRNLKNRFDSFWSIKKKIFKTIEFPN